MAGLIARFGLSLTAVLTLSQSHAAGETLLAWRTDQTPVPDLMAVIGRPQLSAGAIAKACLSLNLDPAAAPTAAQTIILGLTSGRCSLLPDRSDLLDLPVLGNGANVSVVLADTALLLYPQRQLACVPGQCPVLGRPTGVSVPLMAPPAPPPAVVIESFDVSNSPVVAGQSVTLSWSASGVSTCKLSPQGLAADTVPATGSTQRSPTDTTVYELRCSGAGGSDQAQVLVTVTPPPAAAVISSFQASPSRILAGQATLLTWISTGSSCAIAGISTSLRGSSRTLVRPTATQTYTLTCSTSGGSDTRWRTVSVSPLLASAAIDSFSVTPNLISQGAVAVFRWQSSNADACELTGAANRWRLKLGVSGTLKLAPSVSDQFQLTCFNAKTRHSETRQLTVSRLSGKPRVRVFASSTARSIGPTVADIAWESEQASGCGIRRNLDPWSPIPLEGVTMVQVSETTTFTASCLSAGGQSTRLTTVEVVDETVFVGGFEG